jgi:hypothetical protein
MSKVLYVYYGLAPKVGFRGFVHGNGVADSFYKGGRMNRTQMWPVWIRNVVMLIGIFVTAAIAYFPSHYLDTCVPAVLAGYLWGASGTHRMKWLHGEL